MRTRLDASTGCVALLVVCLGCGSRSAGGDAQAPTRSSVTPERTAPTTPTTTRRSTTGAATSAGSQRAAADLAAGCRHACARTSDGGVACWGDNQYGQLGRGSAGGHHRAARVAGVSGVRGVAASCFSTCVSLDDGTARCWGQNGFGDVGDGTETMRPSPVALPDLRDVVAIDGGDGAMCAVTRHGRVHCWGNVTGNTPRSNRPVAISGIDDATQVAVGEGNVCVVRRGGTIVCWGSDAQSGELGSGTTEPRTSPTAVVEVSGATDVSIAGQGGCARVADGELRCWGFASMGREPTCQMRMISGPSGVIQAYCPRPVRLDGVRGARQVALGTGINAAVLESGEVVTWDGYMSRRPTPAGAITDAVSMTAGSNFVCARRRSGAIACWGSNDGGQLGDGTTERSERARDVAIP